MNTMIFVDYAGVPRQFNKLGGEWTMVKSSSADVGMHQS